MQITKQYLLDEYVGKNRSLQEIAEETGKGTSTVGRYITKFGLQKGKLAKRTKEHRRNISVAKGKPVIRIAKGGAKKEYPSISEAARKTGIDHSSIHRCIFGRQKHAGGYNWHYKRTHGEEWYHRVQHKDFRLEIKEIVEGLERGMPPRMPREQAASYYTAKLRKVWRKIGGAA